jgi:hypothetical protein
VVVPGNGGSLVISLLKALSEDWIFSRVKTEGQIMLVSPDDYSVCAVLSGFVLENLFRYLSVTSTYDAIDAASHRCFDGVFVFLFSFFFFGCVHH